MMTFSILILISILNAIRAYLFANLIENMKGKPNLTITDFLELIFSFNGFWIVFSFVPLRKADVNKTEYRKIEILNILTVSIYFLVLLILVCLYLM